MSRVRSLFGPDDRWKVEQLSSPKRERTLQPQGSEAQP